MRTNHLKRRRLPLAELLATMLLFVSCSPSSEQASVETAKAIPHRASQGESCAAHGSPIELCFICDADLRDEGRLWCREHDRYEDRCWECHPELQDEDRLWCAEHSLYEDECFLCHPELLPEDPSGLIDNTTALSLESKSIESTLMCEEHQVLEVECGICHPELLTQSASTRGLKVRMPSAASASKAGVVVGSAGLEAIRDGVDCFAEIAFNQNRSAQITSLVRGVITSVDVDLGSQVQGGDRLATLRSETIGEAQSNFLKAMAEDELHATAFDRQQDLLAQRISSERDHQDAEAAYRASTAALRQARQRLSVLGFGEEEIQAIADQRATPGVFELRAPFAGEIVERSAVHGSVVDASEVLFSLVDTSVIWAMVNIPESQLSRVSQGQSVELTVDSLPDQTFIGKLTWLSARVDEKTRMASGRVEVPNTDRLLKAGMFADATILTTQSDQAVIVPRSAVHHVTGAAIVFVKSADDLFEARPVALGAQHLGRVEITTGLSPHEPVVIAGGFALKSQLLASRLGAGCVDE